MSRWEWLSRSDAAVNWATRLWQLVQWLWPILGPTIVAVAVAGLGWVTYGLLWGLLLALLAALVTQIIATLKARRNASAQAQLAPESEPADSSSQSAPTGKDSRQAEDEESRVSVWDDPQFKFTVRNKKKYRNERVPLDGILYTNCEFVNVTFVFEGAQPYGLVACKIIGKDTTVEAASAPL